jgi:cysteine desulfurase
METEIYLDWNATTPPHPRVLEAMQKAARNAWGNPSSVHAAGRRARAVLEETREAVAGLLELHPRDVLFCSGGTEANNLALRSAPGLATSRIEHPSVIRVAELLAAQGRPVEWLPVPPSGRIEPEAVGEALTRLPAGSVVALMAANHETGVIQPVAEVAERVHAAGARLHVDAVQALAKLPAERWRMADSIALAGHKMRGPKGIGVLAWRGPAPEPLLLGGSQERGLRPGTPDAALAAGLGAALELALDGPARYQELAVLRDELESELSAFAEPNGADAPRLPHVSNQSFRGWRGDELVAALDLCGVRVSSGSACSAGSSEPSGVISAMLGRERGSSALRVSLGDGSGPEQVRGAIDAFLRVLGGRDSSV